MLLPDGVPIPLGAVSSPPSVLPSLIPVGRTNLSPIRFRAQGFLPNLATSQCVSSRCRVSGRDRPVSSHAPLVIEGLRCSRRTM